MKAMVINMENCPEVWELIASARNKRGWTNRQLSQESGIPEPTIQKFLAGATRDPCFSNVINLCKALDLSVDDLVGIDDSDALQRCTKEIDALKTENDTLKAAAALAQANREAAEARERQWFSEKQTAEERLIDARETGAILLSEKENGNRRLQKGIFMLCAVLLGILLFTAMIVLYDMTQPNRGWFRAAISFPVGVLFGKFRF